MQTLPRIVMAALAFALPALVGPAHATDRALVIGNADYTGGADIPGAKKAREAAAALRDAGFTVISGNGQQTGDMRRALSDLLVSLRQGDRMVILLEGHFAHSARTSWFAGVDMSGPDLATIGGMGVSVQAVLDVAAQLPGGAIVLLGTETRSIGLGPGLVAGIGTLAAPQGVAVVQGDAGAIAAFARDQVPRKEVSLAAMLDTTSGLASSGSFPTTPFRGGTSPAPAPAPAPVPKDTSAGAIAARIVEDRAWDAARAGNTAAGYRDYLARYPSGRHAALAKAQVATLGGATSAQPSGPEQAEAALALDRDRRSAVQRQLAILGFDPRGVDGIFGPGSRAALTAWQKAQGFAATGYLSADQATRLASQAARRSAELEAQAAARQAEVDRQDQAYWQRTGALGDEAGLRAYLARYPDGLFATAATTRLTTIDGQRQAAAAGQDRAAWADAQRRNDAKGYRTYLQAFPGGAFAAEARARLGEGEPAAPDPGSAEARAREAALGLDPLTGSLAERRLAALGYDPGPVDGTFDADTRRAIRRFQQARGLPVTGYLDQDVVVALLSGGAFKLGN